jgi:hypothetical protein
MGFRFDRRRALPPIRVSWRLSATTVAGLEEMAKEEGVTAEDVAQQALDHVLEGRRRRQEGAGGGGGAAAEMAPAAVAGGAAGDGGGEVGSRRGPRS